MQRFDGQADNDAGRVLIEELVRTAFFLQDVMSSFLEDMPEDAYPGEDNAAVMLEMVVGTSAPALDSAGEAGCRAATALIGAIRDRIVDDLKLALELAAARE